MHICAARFMDAVAHKKVDKVPFAIWMTGPFCTRLMGMKQKDYYFDDEMKLKIQLNTVQTFPEAMLIPGPFPEFGAVLETSMFGCEIVWHEDDAPHTRALIHDAKEIDKMLPPKDLENCGLMPHMIRQYQYMWNHIPQEYLEGYGFLDGVAYMLGPLEVAATMRGYTEFLMELYLEPQRIHHLLDMVTETLIGSAKIQQKINGPIRRLVMADHMAHQVSPEMFEEFCFPYYKRIYDEFHQAPVRIYHNEGNVSHVAERIPEFGANLMHYGEDTKTMQQKTKGRLALMGNIPPLEVLLNGTPESSYQCAIKCLELGAPAGGYILSSAGGMSAGTPAENIRAAIKACNDFCVEENCHGFTAAG